MPRYSHISRRCRVRHKRGTRIRQLLIPICTRAHYDYTLSATDEREWRQIKVQWIAIADMVTDQRQLQARRLVYQLPRIAEMQKRKRPFTVALPGGKFMVWDGNHRVTAAIMLGRTHLRCQVCRTMVVGKYR